MRSRRTDGRPSRVDRGPAADRVDAGGGDRRWEADGRSASGDGGRRVLPSRPRRWLGNEGGGVQDLPGGGLGHLHGGPLRLLWQPQGLVLFNHAIFILGRNKCSWLVMQQIHDRATVIMQLFLTHCFSGVPKIMCYGSCGQMKS